MIDINTTSPNMVWRVWKMTPTAEQWENHTTGGNKCQAHIMNHKPGTQYMPRHHSQCTDSTELHRQLALQSSQC
jgi:hypothetical protein